MRREEAIDYFAVRDDHLAIHERLNAWARWVRVRPHGWQVQPMFRQYRSKAFQWHTPEVKVAVNIPEAMEMEKAVSLLPTKNREAIRWCYVAADSPGRMARELGVSKAALMDLIHQARTLLIDRGM